ncbi:caspase domain-containing protein [Pedobacter miscanthi]|uniref:caspase family protein n=1 Tax=Pedobacter miscanthi TaxID=2259170 RepID=UPI00292F6384|nr:caspase family protein [Pedobacter miscanthi]
MTHSQPKSASAFSHSHQTSTEVTEGITYIISIGIDRYASAGVVDFVHGTCERDAQDIVECLTAKYENFELFDRILFNEQATKNAILELIRNFWESSFNTHANNLLIYFSGHGTLLDVGDQGAGRGCIIPHKVSISRLNDLITFSNIKDELISNKTKNCLVIVDSCNSGSFFLASESNPLIGSTTIEPKSARYTAALVASRANENAKAGNAGENSLFTKKLLEILRKPDQQEFSSTTLNTYLQNIFNNPTDPKPVFGRIEISGRDNSGEIFFKVKTTEYNKTMAKTFLQDGLNRLNFDDQLLMFHKFKTADKKHLAIFRGKQQSGLWLLAKMSRDNPYFPKKHCHKYGYAYLPGITGNGMDKLLTIFNNLYGIQIGDINTLAGYISSNLAIQGVHINIDLSPRNSEEVLRLKDKKEFIEALISLLIKIDHNYNEDNKLVVCLYDHSDADFKDAVPAAPIANFNMIIFPQIADFDENKATLWYLRERAFYNGNNEKQLLFDQLFEGEILNNLTEICNEAGLNPGKTVEIICARMCIPVLADELLNKPLS